MTYPQTSIADERLKGARYEARRSPCLRRRAGAVLVDRFDHIAAVGRTMPPGDRTSCTTCAMTTFGIRDDSRLDRCRSVHAEAHCLIVAGQEARRGILYVVALRPDGRLDHAWPCPICARLALDARLDAIVLATDRGPRVITPDALIDSHARGFGYALDPQDRARRVQIDPEPRTRRGPVLSTGVCNDWLFGLDLEDKGGAG